MGKAEESRALINIDVDDIKKAEAFYCKVFDLQVTRRFGAGAVELMGLGVPLYLLEKKSASLCCPGTEDTRRFTRHWTPVHLDIVVKDMKAAIQKALDAGAVSESEIKRAPYGELALMADPFGHGFCFIAFSEKGYEAIRSE